jgi:hypothetical protein
VVPGGLMARTYAEITEAEIEAAADVMLTPVAACDGKPTKGRWLALKDEDIIAHQEVGDQVCRMLVAAEEAREASASEQIIEATMDAMEKSGLAKKIRETRD